MSAEPTGGGYTAGEQDAPPLAPDTLAPNRTLDVAAPPVTSNSGTLGGTLNKGVGGTLLPPKKLPIDSRYNMLLMERQKTLGSKDLADQVKLPPGASVEEWLAISTVDFFNELNLLIGGIQDLCTEHTCPEMKAGPYTWLWADGEKCKEPQKLSAPKYCECLLIWVDKQLSDESFLPVNPGSPFPPSFKKGLRVIYKRLFRIYAHVYYSHFKAMMDDEADAHLNHSFKHFVYFVMEFELMQKEDLEPMKDLVALFLDQRSRGTN
jgi:MOB kinase activator 1